ncbi:cystathionine beta-lyase/cystathionine gamma-synthase [Planococcus soli]|uniref:cystathionine beta-lyase/cystathionine gamma-synthase n=1 Tax=Planococcus soli TaxID=2666072 RepID=UPI00115D6E83|nr:cystathionine beta-lyase/cystathionine gamma-synthase [Planococcus soli]
MGIEKIAFTDNVLADNGKRLRELSITNPTTQIKAIHADAPGFIALLRKTDSGVYQRHYKAEVIADSLDEWITYDSYFSMNTFYTPKRLITNLKEIRTAFVDIDCQNTIFTAEQIEAQLKADYFGQSIPTPNLIIHSGRGLNLIWLMDSISGLAVERWNRLQKAIFNSVKTLGADPKAVDAARVFRLAGSINSKNNAIVSCEILHDYRYGLEEMAEEYFPDILKVVKKPKKNQRPNKINTKKPKAGEKVNGGIRRLFNEYTLRKTRMGDLNKLVNLRNGHMEGSREYALFLYRYWALVQSESKEDAVEAMLELNTTFKTPLKEREAIADTKSAERYYDSEEPFRITNERVIEWLDITKEEQRHLLTIIDKAEKRSRNTEYQRTKRGSVTKEEYKAEKSSQKAHKLKQLATLLKERPMATQKELAAELGVSVPSIKKYTSEIRREG